MWQWRCSAGSLSWAVVCGVGLALAFPAGAQAPTPEGGQLQIEANAGNLSWGTPHHVSSASNGDFVVVWRLSPFAIQAQRYASDGSPQGGQFEVNTYSAFVQNSPKVATAPDGDFIVVWQSGGSPETDTDSDSIQGRRFSSDGSPQGIQFQVNSYTTGYQGFPSISCASNGDSIVV